MGARVGIAAAGGVANSVALLGTYAGRALDLSPWLSGAEINRDGNLRLQYLAGLALNNTKEGEIYGGILRFRRFPDDLLVGSAITLAQLNTVMQTRGY